jgi:glutathione S-transferase
MTRVTGQMSHAFRLLDESLATHPPAASERLDQATLTAAVVWFFAHQVVPDLVPLDAYPALRELSARAEPLPAFMAAPHGDSTYRHP